MLEELSTPGQKDPTELRAVLWPALPVPNAHLSPQSPQTDPWSGHGLRPPGEQGRGARTGEGLPEGTRKFKAKKISAFLETLPAISNIFCWQHERCGSRHVCLSLKHCWSDGHFGKGDKNV